MTKRTNSGDMPELIGKGFAHVQHGLDKVIAWGFSQMRSTGEQKPKANAGRASRFVRGALKTFGKMGDAYYRKYDDLKKKS